MFCKKCGAEISDSASFCIKCGNPVNTVKPTSTEHKKQKEGGFSTKIILAIIAAVIIVLIVIIISLINNQNGNNGSEVSTDAVQVSSDGDNIGVLNFTEIVSECPNCEAALNTLVELSDSALEYGYDEDETLSVANKLYQEIQHDCTADIFEVENVPYVYRGVYGTYTGQWQGAGPTGTGSFLGTDKLNGYVTSYNGEWAYGLPNGQGELYIERFLGHSKDMTYKGQMTDGLRNGEGYFQEYYPNSGYMVYGNTVFQNDVLAQETEGELLDSFSGEVKEYCRVKGSEDGDVYATTLWEAGELSPEQKQVVETAEIVLGVAIFGYVMNDIINSDGGDAQNWLNQQKESYANELNNYRQQQAAEQEEQAAKAAEAEKNRQWNEDKYYEAIQSDPDEYYISTRNYKYNAGL